jgi:hypothetical protein
MSTDPKSLNPVQAKRNNLSMDYFRQELAGLIDHAPTATHSDDFREASVSLCVILAKLFGDQLDRITLWDRIASAIKTSAAKRPDGGDGLISVALDHVLADSGKAAACPDLTELVQMAEAKGAAWNRSWAAYITRHVPIIVVRGRAKWKDIKNEK